MEVIEPGHKYHVTSSGTANHQMIIVENEKSDGTSLDEINRMCIEHIYSANLMTGENVTITEKTENEEILYHLKKIRKIYAKRRDRDREYTKIEAAFTEEKSDD